jgi:zinc transport system substrate-binding protein
MLLGVNKKESCMIRYFAKFFLYFILISLGLPSLKAEVAQKKPLILVSVAPYKLFVEEVAGDTVNVELMVPVGASSHTFEPTPKQMLNASHADIWFQIGESFEARAGKALRSHHPEMLFVDLRRGVDLIIDSDPETGRCHCSHHAQQCCEDPHFWLSARQAKIQVKTIAETLMTRYPQYRDLYQKNLAQLIQKLETLDLEIQAILAPLKNRVIMASHPAYAYFCRDYQLKQLSIEFEGKDPSPKQLTRVLGNARKAHIKTIFIQVQYNNKGAQLIAKEIDAKLVTLDPYAENYFAAMREIATQFASQ